MVDMQVLPGMQIIFWEELHKSCVVNVNADSLGGKDAMDVQHSTIMPETMGWQLKW